VPPNALLNQTTGQLNLLTIGAHVLGRSPTVDLLLSDRDASRKHAEVCVGVSHMAIRDLGSKNGTRINGRVLRGTLSLCSGDIIRIGRHSLVVQQLVASASLQPGEASMPWPNEERSAGLTERTLDLVDVLLAEQNHRRKDENLVRLVIEAVDELLDEMDATQTCLSVGQSQRICDALTIVASQQHSSSLLKWHVRAHQRIKSLAYMGVTTRTLAPCQ
jgi:pSer/pThr/pTyr-binding forkhead associated (FHA) protein